MLQTRGAEVCDFSNNVVCNSRQQVLALVLDVYI